MWIVEKQNLLVEQEGVSINNITWEQKLRPKPESEAVQKQNGGSLNGQYR